MVDFEDVGVASTSSGTACSCLFSILGRFSVITLPVSPKLSPLEVLMLTSVPWFESPLAYFFQEAQTNLFNILGPCCKSHENTLGQPGQQLATFDGDFRLYFNDFYQSVLALCAYKVHFVIQHQRQLAEISTVDWPLSTEQREKLS